MEKRLHLSEDCMLMLAELSLLAQEEVEAEQRKVASIEVAFPATKRDKEDYNPWAGRRKRSQEKVRPPFFHISKDECCNPYPDELGQTGGAWRFPSLARQEEEEDRPAGGRHSFGPLPAGSALPLEPFEEGDHVRVEPAQEGQRDDPADLRLEPVEEEGSGHRQCRVEPA